MSLPITTGIEIELWVTDRDGKLADGRVVSDAHPRIEPEFVPCMLEVKTRPHEQEDELREDLYWILRTAIEHAAEHDLRLVPFGTPLTQVDMDATATRGKLFEELYGDGVIAAKNCAGSHIHFEQSNVARQLNLLTALDPALSLVSASPYYCGERDLDCSRAIAYRLNCGSEFQRFCQLQGYVASVDEWEERIDRLYEDFCAIAADHGVPREVIAEHFRPENTVLNPVRLQQELPTVEWRAPDSTLPSHILRLAVDMGELVAQTDSKPLEYGSPGVTDDQIGVPEFDTLQTLSRLAMRSGCHSGQVERYLERMGFNVSNYDPLSSHVEGSAVLSHSEACRLRLEQSQRLLLDVRRLTRRCAADPIEHPQLQVNRVRS
jgi:gamma-glutamyl:cysteine ligase YbdK (ATP-grasp superfamily)